MNKKFYHRFNKKWYKWVIVCLALILTVVYIKRKQIVEHPFTQKKMEFLKALYEQDLDSAKQVIDEVIDSSFYIK